MGSLPPPPEQEQLRARLRQWEHARCGTDAARRVSSGIAGLNRQLAVETGGTLGLLLRGADARGQPSFAALRLLVEPLPVRRGPRRVRLTLLGAHTAELELEIDDETCHVRVAGKLADPASARRASGA